MLWRINNQYRTKSDFVSVTYFFICAKILKYKYPSVKLKPRMKTISTLTMQEHFPTNAVNML